MKKGKDDDKTVECPICGEPVTPQWEPKYNGSRATCDNCKLNWAES